MKKRMYFTKILIARAGLMFHTVISDTKLGGTKFRLVVVIITWFKCLPRAPVLEKGGE